MNQNRILNFEQNKYVPITILSVKLIKELLYLVPEKIKFIFINNLPNYIILHIKFKIRLNLI